MAAVQLKPKVKEVGLRSILQQQAKDCRAPIFAHYASISGDNTKLRAHDAYITALQDGKEVVVSAWDLASALQHVGAPRDAIHAVESSQSWYAVNPDGEFEPA